MVRDSNARLRAVWERIERWFETRLPGISLGLRPPATEDQIGDAEVSLSLKLPDDVRSSVLVHDGQEDEPGIFWLPFAQRLGSLASIVRCWEQDRRAFDDDPERLTWLDKSQRVRQVHFHPRQIPIAGSPDWDHARLLLDFIPAPAGTAGQVIVRDGAELVYLCSSFGELLEQTAHGLESGRIVPKPPPGPGYTRQVQCLTPRSKKPLSFYKFYR